MIEFNNQNKNLLMEMLVEKTNKVRDRGRGIRRVDRSCFSETVYPDSKFELVIRGGGEV